MRITTLSSSRLLAAAALAFVRDNFRLFAVLAGGVLLVRGMFMVYEPLGYIVPGALLVALAVVGAVRETRGKAT